MLYGVAAAVGTAALAGVLYFIWNHGKPIKEDPPPASILEVLALSEDLKSEDKETRARAAVALGKAGKEARAALPALLEALRDEDDNIRDLVKDALEQAGPPAKEDMPAVSTALRDDDPDVRSYAVSVLEEMGEEAWGEIDQVRELAEDSDPHVRAAAEKTLARLEKEILEALRKRLADPSPDVRRQAAEGMSELGSASSDAAKSAAGSLMDALGDENEAVRDAVSRALSEFGSEVVPILASALSANDKVKRRTAIASLGIMGADAVDAAPALAAVVASDPDVTLANLAAETLAARLGDFAVPALAGVLASPTIIDNRRGVVQNALIRIGPGALPGLNYYVGRYPAFANNAHFKQVFNQINNIHATPWAPRIDPYLRGYYDPYYRDYLARAGAWYDAKGHYLDLAKAQKGLGLDGNSFRSFLKRVDRNGDGQISRQEYDRWAHEHATQLAREDHARKAVYDAQKTLRNNLAASTKAAQQQAAAIVRHVPARATAAKTATSAKSTDQQRAAAEAQLRSMRKKAQPQQVKAQQDLISKQRALARVQRQAPSARHAPQPTRRAQPVRQTHPQVGNKSVNRRPVVHHPVAHHAAPAPQPRKRR
jgi:HEAT repeat protein